MIQTDADNVDLSRFQPVKGGAGHVSKGFDYLALEPAEAEAAKTTAAWVRSTYGALEATTLETFAEIGERLLQARETVGHGRFMAWVKAECGGISHTTAGRMMDVARNIGLAQIPHVVNLPRRLVYDVAAASTPEDIRSDFKAKAAAGVLEPAEFENRIALAKSELIFARARMRDRKASPEKVAAFQKRNAERDRRAALARLDEEDARAAKYAEDLRIAREVADAVKARLTADEFDRFGSSISQLGRVETIAAALREAFVSGAREERDMLDAKRADERKRQREALTTGAARR